MSGSWGAAREPHQCVPIHRIPAAGSGACWSRPCPLLLQRFPTSLSKPSAGLSAGDPQLKKTKPGSCGRAQLGREAGAMLSRTLPMVTVPRPQAAPLPRDTQPPDPCGMNRWRPMLSHAQRCLLCPVEPAGTRLFDAHTEPCSQPVPNNSVQILSRAKCETCYLHCTGRAQCVLQVLI